MTIKLTKHIACALIHRVCPGVKVKKEIPPSGVPNFWAETGELEIRCETDYIERDGLIRLKIFDSQAGGCWTMAFDPITLERMFPRGKEDPE